MNINRRSFFRTCAIGLAAAAVPAILRPEKIQGKIIAPKKGMYGWAEHGFVCLDNRRIILAEMDDEESKVRIGGRLIGREELAKALETPLRHGVLSGDVLSDIYSEIEDISHQEFPLDFLKPNEEADYQSFTIPNSHIPTRRVEGDYVMVPTYDIGASVEIEWDGEVIKNAAKKMHEMEQKRWAEILLEYGEPNLNDDIFVAPERGDVELIIGLDTKTNETKTIS